jgi:hypothetical protein
MSQPYLGKAPDLSQAVEFTALGERFRMVRASQGLLDIGVYHLEALSPGAGPLLAEDEGHEAVWAKGLEALEGRPNHPEP